MSILVKLFLMPCQIPIYHERSISAPEDKSSITAVYLTKMQLCIWHVLRLNGDVKLQTWVKRCFYRLCYLFERLHIKQCFIHTPYRGFFCPYFPFLYPSHCTYSSILRSMSSNNKGCLSLIGIPDIYLVFQVLLVLVLHSYNNVAHLLVVFQELLVFPLM